MMLPDCGVKRTSALQPGVGPVASRTIVPSSSGDPTSTVQPASWSERAICSLAVAALRFETNAALEGAPELVNQEPYGLGWIFAVELSDPSELDGLMDAAAYRAFTEG